MSVRTNRRFGGVDLDELLVLKQTLTSAGRTDLVMNFVHKKFGLRGDEDPATPRGGPERALHEGGAHQRT